MSRATGLGSLLSHYKDLKNIKDYYYEIRYPNIDFYIPIMNEAKEALKIATEVLDILKGYLL